MLVPIYALFVQKVGGSALSAGLTAGALAFASAFSALLSGKLIDRYQPSTTKYFLVTGWCLIALSALLYVFVKNVAMLFAVQIFAGFVKTISAPAFDTLYARHLDKESTGQEYGLWEASFFITAGIGSVLGGILVTVYGFNGVFYGMALLAFIAACYVGFLPKAVLWANVSYTSYTIYMDNQNTNPLTNNQPTPSQPVSNVVVSPPEQPGPINQPPTPMQPNSSKRNFKKLLPLILLAIVLLGVGAWWMSKKNGTTNQSSSSASTKNESASTPTTSPPASQPKNGSTNKQTPSATPSADDLTKAKAAIDSFHTRLETAYTTYGFYPDEATAITTCGDECKPSNGIKYVYKPLPDGCTTDATNCQHYELSAIITSNGQTFYSIKSDH